MYPVPYFYIYLTNSTVIGKKLLNIKCVIKVFYSPTNAQVIVLKTVLKFTLK